jgi:hypothetical protein
MPDRAVGSRSHVQVAHARRGFQSRSWPHAGSRAQPVIGCHADKGRGEKRVTIDIDRLTEAELIDLNHRIVERLRFL